ncbi:MAG: XRE family transcriptional regulator [Acidobacteria bacterium]|nr:XRE family transcriptional regulator [Acidobacteriota bacterium]
MKPIMDKTPTNESNLDLSEFIRKIISEEDLSQRYLVERAERKGYKITQSYISQIISGAASNITIEKLRALAAALDRPEEELFNIALGRKTEEGRLRDALVTSLLDKFSQLTDADKKEMVVLLKAINREIEERLRKY